MKMKLEEEIKKIMMDTNSPASTPNKLYLVTIKWPSSVYVVAKDLNEAYLKLKDFLIEHDLGNWEQRQLESVKFIAEVANYNMGCTILITDFPPKQDI